MATTNGSSPKKVDGRSTRSERSRQSILRAYMELVSEARRQPTALQIAERAGCSLRLIFQHFADLGSLTLAAAKISYQQGRARGDAAKLDGDRDTRIRTHMERRARNCEAWLPLWRVGHTQYDQSPELARLGSLVRKATMDRFAVMYAPELAGLSDVERRRLLIAFEAITDYESWGRLRDEHGLSVEQATAHWVGIVDRMLPPTPAAAYETPKRPASETAEVQGPAVHGPSAAGGEQPLSF